MPYAKTIVFLYPILSVSIPVGISNKNTVSDNTACITKNCAIVTPAWVRTRSATGAKNTKPLKNANISSLSIFRFFFILISYHTKSEPDVSDFYVHTRQKVQILMIEFMMDFVLTRVCAPQALPVNHRLFSHLAAALACLPYSACIFRSVF